MLMSAHRSPASSPAFRCSRGDHVKQGELLAEIDPQILAARVEVDRADMVRLQADLADAQAQADYAAGEFRRQTRLKRDDATRDDTYEQARRDMRSSAAKTEAVQAQIAQAESQLKADVVQLGYTRIFAPMAGTVVSVDARQGQTINANYSAPVLMRIADLATMTVWTQVSEADISRLHVNMKLYFTTLGFGDRRWEGGVAASPAGPAQVHWQNWNGRHRQRDPSSSACRQCRPLHRAVRCREPPGRAAPGK